MEYESNILKRLIKTYGVVGNPRYISEIIKEFIVQGKERFPELFTYQSDWLAHIDVFGLNPSYTVSYTGQSFYAPNTLEKPVKSAILKGNTLVNIVNNGNWAQGGPYGDLFTQNISIKKGQIYTVIGKTEESDIIDDSQSAPALRICTGTNNSGTSLLFIQQSDVVIKQTFTNNENDTIHIRFFNQRTNYKKLMIIEGDHTQEDIPYFEGMQSVKMPVLRTTGKNLFDINGDINQKFSYMVGGSGNVILGANSFRADSYSSDHHGKGVILNLKPNTTYTISGHVENFGNVNFMTGGWNPRHRIVKANGYFKTTYTPADGEVETCLSFVTFSTSSDPKAIFSNIQVEESPTPTQCEPYKSNILTVNEEVELGSVGEVKDELNLLTGQLTQRTETRAYQEGDESNSEVLTDMTNTRYKLPKEAIKTVDLTILEQYGQNVKQLMTFNGGTHFNAKSLEGSPLPSISVTVETDLVETLKVCSLEGNTM